MREINRILCPVDLSDVSRDAINHAVLLARWYKAKITALHVCNPLVVPETDFTVLGFRASTGVDRRGGETSARAGACVFQVGGAGR